MTISTIRKTVLTTAFAGLAALAFGAAPAAAAEDCYRGTLDAQYCDRNHDQVADLPLDPKDWVNPDTIIFSYTPVEDPAVYAKVWDGFVQHLSKVTGKKAVFFPVQSYAAQYEAMRSGRLHIAGVNTGGNP
ncbi:MAG: PhnD/SsuA/transferrin family substrate-binding protein, partial [Rhodospirillaceae bacterium]